MGVVERLARVAMLFVSDVVNATREALGVLASGHNPYLHAFATTAPPGSPFPYLPGELFLYGIPYALFRSIDGVDRALGIATVVVLAALAPVVGTARAALAVAVFGTFSLAISTSVDGTNDGGLALLLAAAAVFWAWGERGPGRPLPPRAATACADASAVCFAWALLYKGLAWPFLPFVAIALVRRDPARARRYLTIVGALCVVAVVPFLFPAPSGLIGNVYRGFVFHQGLYGLNVWTALANAGLPLPGEAVMTLVYVFGVGAAFLAAIRRPGRTYGGALLRGAGVVLTALLFAHFSTSSYYTFLATTVIVALALPECAS